MKQLFDLLPMLLHAVWITRKEKSEIATAVRILLICLVLSTYLLVSSMSEIYHGVQDQINRHEIGLQKRIKYPALAAAFTHYDACYGSPYAIFKSYSKWIECDLESMGKAVELGVGLDYIKFAAERDADIEFAGIKVYPVPKGPALPPPRQ